MASAEGSTRGGLRAVLVATVVAGAFGYVIQLAAPAMLPPAAYVAFTTFWSTLYLGVAAMSGIQQEVTRASRPAADEPPSAVLRNFALISLAVAVAVSAVVGLLVAPGVLPSAPIVFAAALAVGLGGYLATAVLSGVLYGLSLWRAVAGIIIADAALRTVLLLVGFALGLPIAVLALLVAAPFGLAFVLTWLAVRGRVIGRFRLDVGLARLSAHALGTVLAAAASGVMITGLPMLIGVTSAGVPAAEVGAVLLTITLTRAPIVVPVIALQSFLISAVFRGGRVAPARLLRVIAVLLLVVAALSGLAAAVGPPIVSFVSAGAYEIAPALAAAIVFSAGLVAAMSVTGPALIAARRHTENLVGWAVAAALTVAIILLPLGLDVRVGIAVTAPPVLGLLVHVGALLVPSWRAGAEPESVAREPLG